MRSVTKLFSATAVSLLFSVSAHAAEIVIEPVINLAPAPVVMAPSPAYVSAPWVEGYDPHHRRHDWQYWQGHRDHRDHDHR